MKKLLTLLLLLSPSLLLAKTSVKEQLQQAKQDIAMLEEEVIRLNNQQRQLRKIEYDVNKLTRKINRPKKEKRDSFFLVWIYRPFVFIASICTMLLTACLIYFYVSPYSALTNLGLSETIVRRLGIQKKSANSSNPRVNRRFNSSIVHEIDEDEMDESDD